MFYWKCAICRGTIREDHTEIYSHKRVYVHYHKRCLEKEQSLEQEANKILLENGFDINKNNSVKIYRR